MIRVVLISIRIIISLILAVIAYRYALFYNLHMFQLNGYKNGEHFVWIRKFIRRQWVLIAGVVIGIATVIFPGAVTDWVTLLWFLLIIAVYQALCGMSQKKPLVYTARVKRLTATVIVLDVILLCAGILAWDKAEGLFIAGAAGSRVFARVLGFKLFYGGYGTLARLDGILMITVGLKILSCIIANIVNKPIERAVSDHFINDAKRILREAKDMTIIGVTGSYGKTSVKYYLGELLSAKYNVLITPESYNTPMGVVRTLRERMKPGTEIFVCEMGARHVGDIKELCDLVHPHHGIITSIGPQHLETFFNMENIVSTKYELADALPKDGMLFLNWDNEYVRGNAGKYSNVIGYSGTEREQVHDPDAADKQQDNVVSSGISHSTEAHMPGETKTQPRYSAHNIILTPQGTTFEVSAPDGESETYTTSLIGAHNIVNITGAIAVAHSMGIALKDLRIPVRRLRSVPHRLELKRNSKINIIDDAYNSNPVGSKAALDTLALFDGMKIMITPGMVELGDKEEEYNYEFGRHAAEVCDHLLLVGHGRTDAIRRGAEDCIDRISQIRTFDHFEDAFAYASQIPCDTEKYILLENDLPDNY